jgi:hypothetical protein
MIDKFFRDCTEDQITKMLNIINKESEISLRILDWFVTRYAKKKIDFEINGLQRDEIFDVHISYKAQLKSYKKTYFDPFRRRKKFYYSYDMINAKKNVYTTIGQLNFFRWAISNNIIEYVEKNLSQLTKAMNSSNKEDKKKKQQKSSFDCEDSDDSDCDETCYSDDSDDCDRSSYESSTDYSSKKKIIVNHNKKTIIQKPKIKKNKNKSINISASEDIIDDEIQIIINFD